MNACDAALLVRCIERVMRMDESFAASCEMSGDVASGRDWRGEIAELKRLRASIQGREHLPSVSMAERYGGDFS